MFKIFEIKEPEIKVKGVHILSICDARSDKAQFLQELCEEVRIERSYLIRHGLQTRKKLKELHDKYSYYISQLHKYFKLREAVVENTTVTEGRSVLAQRLGGDTTYTGIANYTALGSDNSAAVIGDTALGTETYRKALTSGTDLNNIAYLETFFTASEVTGTFEEYGNFIDGTGAADSGQLFNRFTQTVVKSAVETLNVQSIITFLDA